MNTKIDINDPKFDPIEYYKKFLKFSRGQIFSHVFSYELTRWVYEEDIVWDLEQLLAIWMEIGIIGEKEDTQFGDGYRINRSRLNEIGIIYD